MTRPDDTTAQLVAVPAPPDALYGPAAGLADIAEGRVSSVKVTPGLPAALAAEICHAAESANLLEVTTPAQAARGAREWHRDPHTTGRRAAGPHAAWYDRYEDRPGMVRLVDLDYERGWRDPDGSWSEAWTSWPADSEFVAYCGWCGTRATATTSVHYQAPPWAHGVASASSPAKFVAMTFDPCGHSVDRYVVASRGDRMRLGTVDTPS